MKISRLWLRSARGQLTLLGIAYLGAVVLAVVALCLRSVLFERLVGESYRKPPDRLAVLLRTVAAEDATPEQLQQLKEEDPGLLYEAWLGDAGLDPQGRLARRLLSLHGEGMLERVRRTLALGTVAQRTRAVDLLAFAQRDELRPEVVRLCHHELRRAQRRGEDDLAGRLRRVLGAAAND
jgi:hypothetical protein